MNGNAALRKANAEELKLYYDWMGKQFHPGELKRLSHIADMCERGLYSAHGLWAGE